MTKWPCDYEPTGCYKPCNSSGGRAPLLLHMKYVVEVSGLNDRGKILIYLRGKPTGKGKVVPMQATNLCGGSTDRQTVQHQTNLVVTFALRSLCPLDKETLSLHRRLGELHSRSRRWGRQKKYLSSTQNRTPVPLFCSH